jgi:hypothetical protein
MSAGVLGWVCLSALLLSIIIVYAVIAWRAFASSKKAMDDKSALLALYWKMKKSQIIALNAISDAGVIAAAAANLARAAEEIEARVAKVSDARYAQSTSLYLDQIINYCDDVKNRADAVSQKMNSYSGVIGDFVKKMEEHSSEILENAGQSRS